MNIITIITPLIFIIMIITITAIKLVSNVNSNMIVIIVAGNHCSYLEGVEGLSEDGTVVVVVADGDGDASRRRVDAVVGRYNQRVLVLFLSVQWYGGHNGACMEKKRFGLNLNNSKLRFTL